LRQRRRQSGPSSSCPSSQTRPFELATSPHAARPPVHYSPLLRGSTASCAFGHGRRCESSRQRGTSIGHCTKAIELGKDFNRTLHQSDRARQGLQSDTAPQLSSSARTCIGHFTKAIELGKDWAKGHSARSFVRARRCLTRTQWTLRKKPTERKRRKRTAWLGQRKQDRVSRAHELGTKSTASSGPSPASSGPAEVARRPPPPPPPPPPQEGAPQPPLRYLRETGLLIERRRVALRCTALHCVALRCTALLLRPELVLPGAAALGPAAETALAVPIPQRWWSWSRQRRAIADPLRKRHITRGGGRGWHRRDAGSVPRWRGRTEVLLDRVVSCRHGSPPPRLHNSQTDRCGLPAGLFVAGLHHAERRRAASCAFDQRSCCPARDGIRARVRGRSGVGVSASRADAS
jgi:hypothetical protein